MWKGQRVDEDGGGGREAEFWGDEGCSGYDKPTTWNAVSHFTHISCPCSISSSLRRD